MRIPQTDTRRNIKRYGRIRILGQAYDTPDGQLRFSVSDECDLIGGSEIIHEKMQQYAHKIHLELERLGINSQRMTYEQYKQVCSIVNAITA